MHQVDRGAFVRSVQDWVKVHDHPNAARAELAKQIGTTFQVVTQWEIGECIPHPVTREFVVRWIRLRLTQK